MSDNLFKSSPIDNSESNKVFETYSKNMCPLYKTVNKSSLLFNINIKNVNNNSYLVSGNVSSILGNKFIKFFAANPPTYNSTFTGSGLPYPSEDVAFENTPNTGTIKVENGKFTFSIRYPNSYYMNMGNIYIPPCVKIVLIDDKNTHLSEVMTINLGEGIPFRTLVSPEKRTGPEFYKKDDLIVRTQYQILLDSAYPLVNKTPKNFWGAMPPH